MAKHDNTDEHVLEEAMDWFLRRREPSRTADDERDFAAWMESSAKHREAWMKTCRTWEVLGQTMPFEDEDRHLGSKRAAFAFRRRRRAWGVGAALAVAACLVLALAGPSLLIRFQADFQTATAELRKITLEDGSEVELAPASAIATDFVDGARHVTLLAGEAFFEVRHDPSRPFVVTVGEVNVTVLGTSFDVRLKPDETTVELVRGAVRLSVDGGQDTLALAPGDAVTVGRGGRQISRYKLAPEDMAAWRNGRLFVNDVTIASVVEELQRYHPAWISIPSGDLAGRRVTGLYNLSDPERALEALVQPYGGNVHRISPYLRVLTLF